MFLGHTLYLAEGHPGRTLAWKQRIAAAIGVAKGIEFLNTGIVPAVYSNKLKITNILLDQNLVAKISSYNLPMLTDNMRKVLHKFSFHGNILLEKNSQGGLLTTLDITGYRWNFVC